MKRVLVIEDDPEIVNVLSELLTRHGYHVREARHGIAAIVTLTDPEEPPPDVVILDIGLPLQGGISVLEFIRRTMHSSLPVIVLTASASQEEEEKLLKLGISRLLRKPASAEALISAVAEAVGEAC